MELQWANAGQAEQARLKATDTADHTDHLYREALWPHQRCIGPMHVHCFVRVIRLRGLRGMDIDGTRAPTCELAG